MPLVIEFQKVELSRLLRDNTRLNRRLDQMMEELRHLREMQQREQVLRQQDQTLRQRAQTLIERLTATPPAGPVPSSVRAAVPPVAPPAAAPAPATVSSSPGPAAASQLAPATPDAGPSNLTAPPAGAAPMDVPETTTIGAGITDEPTVSSRKEALYAYEADAPPPGPPSLPPSLPPPLPQTGPQSEPDEPSAGESSAGESSEGARGDSTELADMLKDIALRCGLWIRLRRTRVRSCHQRRGPGGRRASLPARPRTTRPGFWKFLGAWALRQRTAAPPRA